MTRKKIVSNSRPVLLITCGLMGTGKSTLARELAKSRKMIIISSDVVRKQLAGMPANVHCYEQFGKGIYSPDFSVQTYQKMLERAKELLTRGTSVILDAAFIRAHERNAAAAVARETNAHFLCLETVCSSNVVRRRLARRLKHGKDISDGRWALYPMQKARFEPVKELPAQFHIVIDTTTLSIKKCVKKILEKLNGQNLQA